MIRRYCQSINIKVKIMLKPIIEPSAKTGKRLGAHGLVLSIDYDSNTTPGTMNMIAQVSSSNLAICRTQAVSEATLDSMVNTMIDEIVEEINTSFANNTQVNIEFAYNFKNTDNYISDLNEIINERYGFKMAVGNVKQDRFFDKLTVSLDSIPPFINMANASPIKLTGAMMQNIGEVIEIGYHQPPKSQEEVLVLLRTESTYDRWSPLLKEALFMTLLENISGVNLIYTANK